MQTRIEILRAADAILAAHPEPKPPVVRARYRGGWPAMNWLAKRDATGAACLWRAAQTKQPQPANDNRSDAKGLAADRRPSGKPRGPNRQPTGRSIADYLAMRPAAPRMGDAEPAPAVLPPQPGTFASDGAAFWEVSRFTTKPQRDRTIPLSPFGSFTRCLPAIAVGAHFMGADSGLGQPRPSSRGDVRLVEEPEPLEIPPEIEMVIEVVLSRGNVSDVGAAFGATGGGADRLGGRALLAAAKWASEAAGWNDNIPTKAAA